MQFIKITMAFMSLVLIIYIFALGKALILPFVLALLIWYGITSISNKCQNFHIGKWHVPYWLALLVAAMVVVFVIYLLYAIISANINDVIAQAPSYQAKLEQILTNSLEFFGINGDLNINEILATIDLTNLFSNVASVVSTLAGYMGMIMIYLLFLFLETQTYEKKMINMFPNNNNRERIQETINKIGADINKYLSIKTFVSFLTALFSYIVMVIIGVDFAAFWAILIFLLNYIPTIGSIIAVVFPILLTLVQFDTITPFIVTSILLVSIQFGVGNILEPKLMGRSLNLSSIVIIASLAVWGAIWGIPGMFLCVPIMVIINIILSKFEATKPVAVLLSATGNVE